MLTLEEWMDAAADAVLGLDFPDDHARIRELETLFDADGNPTYGTNKQVAEYMLIAGEKTQAIVDRLGLKPGYITRLRRDLDIQWRPDYDRDDVERLLKDGMSIHKVSVATGAPENAVRTVRKDLGLTRAPNRDGIEERLARAKAMIEDGASHYEVAKTLKMAPETLRRHFPGSQWSPQEAGHHAITVRYSNEAIDKAWDTL